MIFKHLVPRRAILNIWQVFRIVFCRLFHHCKHLFIILGIQQCF